MAQSRALLLADGQTDQREGMHSLLTRQVYHRQEFDGEQSSPQTAPHLGRMEEAT